MNKLATDVFANFELSALDSHRPTNEEVHVLVLGNCGVGKSRLVNNICGSNIQTRICHKNLTLTLSQFKSKFNRNLYLCDAPGVSSHSLDSSLIIRNALTCLPWNLIIIQSKLDARFSYNTLPELQALARLFKKESSRVVLMVSWLDIEQKQQQRTVLLQKFKQQLERCSFTEKLIIFSNQSSDFETISHILYKVGCQFPKIKFVFDNRKLLNLLGVDRNESSVEQVKNELKREQEREKILDSINKLGSNKNQEEVKEELNELDQKHNQDPMMYDNETRNLKHIVVLTTEYEIDAKQEIKKFDKNGNTRVNKIKQLTPEASDQFINNIRSASCSKAKQKQHLLQCKILQAKIKQPYQKLYRKKNYKNQANGSASQSISSNKIQYGSPQMFDVKTFMLKPTLQKYLQETYIPQKYILQTPMLQLPFDKLRSQLSVSQVQKTEAPIKKYLDNQTDVTCLQKAKLFFERVHDF